MPTRSRLRLLLLLFLAAACAAPRSPTPDAPLGRSGGRPPPPPAPRATRTPTPTATPDRSPTPSPPAPDTPVLYLGLMVHLEGWKDDVDRGRFQEHARLVREYAALFEAHGAKVTWESGPEFTGGILRWGDNVLLEMERRGHAVGLHADVGGSPRYDCRRFADDLKALKADLEALGGRVRHVSGIVSGCDWVTAAADAGFLFTTGQVAYAVASLPPEKRPPEYRDCPSPADCHQTFPPDLEDRLHPWRMRDGADWLRHDPQGRLVLLPASGSLPCLAEERAGEDLQGCGRTFDPQDLDAFFQELDRALALAEPGKVNQFYVGWSLGTPLDPELLEAWLAGIDPYVEAGQVRWATLPEIYDAYVRWEEGR